MTKSKTTVAVIGAGPAGLMAADRLSAAGVQVTLIERMPSVGRKFLMAGRGGLNLTHSEPLDKFVTRYGRDASPQLFAAVRAWTPEMAVRWAEDLGQPTFVGSSGRVFPKAMKASPLLRAWLARLAERQVQIRLRTQWLGWDDSGAVRLRTGDVETVERFDAVVLALGGASWPRLGADGSWVEIVNTADIAVRPLAPANVGIRVAWTDYIKDRHAGAPLKRIAVRADGQVFKGEAVITRQGLEGGAIYAAGEAIRRVYRDGAEPAAITIDLRADLAADALGEAIAEVPTKQSIGNVLRKGAGLSPAATAIVNEIYGAGRPGGPLPRAPLKLAAAIKSLPIRVDGFGGLDRAISTAGGVAFEGIDERWMLRHRPGVFVAGEMLDWTAPTGGYLLQACFATGVAAAGGVLDWLGNPMPASASP